MSCYHITYIFNDPGKGGLSQVQLYERLKKWYLMPPLLTFRIIRYESSVQWSNPEKGVAPFPTHWFSR